MRILVTGGAGFIGSHVVDEYLAEEHEVVVLDDFSTGKWNNVHPGVADACEIDICDRQDVREVMNAFHPDVVNHHAAMVDVTECEEDPGKAHKVNVEGTRIVCEEAVAVGVKRFIFASSGGAIYGECREPAKETYPTKPYGVYGLTKLEAEEFILKCTELTAVILRYANVYGPRGLHGVIPAFTKAANKGLPLTIYGDGEQVRDFIHVMDVARANVLALEHEGIFNIASGRSMSINELARAIGGEAGHRYHFSARMGEIRESRLDVSLAKDILAFEANSLVAAGR